MGGVAGSEFEAVPCNFLQSIAVLNFVATDLIHTSLVQQFVRVALMGHLDQIACEGYNKAFDMRESAVPTSVG